MSVVAQLGYTPRGTQLRDTPMVSLSPAKIPAVFQRGTPVPWTPRGSPERPKIGEDALAKGSPTEAKHTVEGASGQGVLAEMVGAGSGSVDSSQRGGSESSRSDSDSPAVFTLSLAPVSTSSPPQGQGLAQWTPAHEPASLPRGGADAPPRSEADLSEISEANEENDVSVHASNASLHGDDDFSRMPMSINGVVLDGMQGLSEDIRKNLGTFVRHMRENQNDIAVQAQSCIFLAKYSAYRESSRAKASKAGAMHTVLEVLRKFKDSRNENHAIVNELACWCLNMLSLSKENAVIIAHAGGVKLVTNAIASFMSSPGVVEQGLWVIRSVASQSVDLHSKVRSKAIVDCVRAAGSAHSENKRVATCAEACLELLCEGDSPCGSPLASISSPKKSSPLKQIIKKVGKVLKSPSKA